MVGEERASEQASQARKRSQKGSNFGSNKEAGFINKKRFYNDQGLVYPEIYFAKVKPNLYSKI